MACKAKAVRELKKMTRPAFSSSGQPRLFSFLEALCNTLLGFGISVLANWLLLPLWGFAVSPRASVEIGLAFTLVSVARSYLLRRLFNWYHTRRRSLHHAN